MNVTGPRSSHLDVRTLQQNAPEKKAKPAHTHDNPDLPRLNRLRERTHALMSRKVRDDAPPSVLSGTNPLDREIGWHVQKMHRYDHAVGLDQVGKGSFTQRRAFELNKVPGGQAAALQYGQSYAADMDAEPPYPRLRIGNNTEVHYHREKPGKKLQVDLQNLYNRRHDPLPEGHNVAFFNSAHSLGFARSLLPDAAASPEPKVLAPGVLALPYPAELAENMGDLIVALGANPSPYQVQNALAGPLPPVQPRRDVNNLNEIKSLMPSARLSPSTQLRAASPTEGTGAMAHTAADLVDDLCHVLTTPLRPGQEPALSAHLHNPLLQQGLTQLRLQLENMTGLHNDSARFGNAYRGMMEELHVVLATAKPYTSQDFKEAALKHLNSTTASTTGLTEPEVYLTTSGMNAIWQGLEAARISSADNSFKPLSTATHGETPVYYEVNLLMEFTGHKRDDDSRTLLATLNNSYPQAAGREEEPWGVEAVIEATRNEVAQHRPGERPFTLVLDSTLELRGDLKKLTGDLSHELATGKLQIAVCKSYQKFANLCSSKVMAGSITLIGADSQPRRQADAHLATVEDTTAWMDNNESQLMTHFVRSGHNEFNLLDRAVANAAFVRDTCFTGEGEHASFEGYDRHLPFAMMAENSEDDFAYPGLTIRDAAGVEKMIGYNPTDNINTHVIRARDSFGFSETVNSQLPQTDSYDSETMRLPFGQESKAELTEMFYMPSRSKLADGKSFSPREALDHVNELIRGALTPDQLITAAHKPLAYRLALVGANQAPRLDDQQRLTGSVASMRRTLEQQSAGRDFTLNKVTSVVSHLGSLTLNNDMMADLAAGPDRETADHLIEGLMGSNMPGVSRMGRETVARFHTALCEADMNASDPERRQKGVERLVDGLGRMNVANVRGAYVKCVPDAVFDAQPLELRQRVLDLVFRPLSRQARFELVDRQLKTHQLSFAESCIDILERENKEDPAVSRHLESRRTILAQTKVQEQTQAGPASKRQKTHADQ